MIRFDTTQGPKVDSNEKSGQFLKETCRILMLPSKNAKYGKMASVNEMKI